MHAELRGFFMQQRLALLDRAGLAPRSMRDQTTHHLQCTRGPDQCDWVRGWLVVGGVLGSPHGLQHRGWEKYFGTDLDKVQGATADCRIVSGQKSMAVAIRRSITGEW